MSTEIARRDPAPVRLETEQIKFIANSTFVPEHYRGKLPEIMACIATGREMGIGDMEALQMIYVIDGRPSVAAELMVKRARLRGHSIRFEQGEGWAKAHGQRADNGDTHTTHWTMARAEKMGLASKRNWKTQPETMLLWRAASELCRLLFPDVLGGAIYTPDEAEYTPEDRIVHALSGALPLDDGGPDDGPVSVIRAGSGEQAAVVEARAKVAMPDLNAVIARLEALAPGIDWRTFAKTHDKAELIQHADELEAELAKEKP